MLNGGIIHKKEINMFYVYQHRKADTNEIFYVGKGKGRRINQLFGRNVYWYRVVDKHGFISEKIADNLEEEFAFLLEIETIDIYRKRGIKLVNATDGGEGSSGYKHTKEHKEKLKGNSHGSASWGINFKGCHHSEETKARWSEMRKGTPSPRKGVKLSDETKNKISESRKGKPVFAKRILNDEEVREIKASLGYRNIAILARRYGVGESTIRRIKNGESYKEII